MSCLATAFLFLTANSPGAEPLVVVVDGAGDFRGCSKAVARVVEMFAVPVKVEPFPWSHGHGKIYKDQVDDNYSKAKGKELADWLKARRAEYPDRLIILISYSAGSAVAFAAADHLSEGFLERHIMLSPSISSRCDIRPSLKCTAKGLDVFCSTKDRFALGVAMRIVGTADESHDRLAAGRKGFTMTVVSEGDRELARKLRHHFWTEDDAKLGHDGRHHGVHAPEWLKKHVVPFLKSGGD